MCYTGRMDKKQEVWKRIPGYEAYEVSNLGNIRSYVVLGKYGYVSDTPQRTLRPGKSRRYLTVALTDTETGVRRSLSVHKLVMLAFVGRCPSGMEIHHKDRNPENNILSNLCYTTHAENMRQAIRSGNAGRKRMVYDDDLAKIKEMYQDGVHTQTIADMFGVVRHYVYELCKDVKRRKIDLGPQVKRDWRITPPDIVARIREMRKNGMSLAKIAHKFCLSESGVYRICNRERHADTPSLVKP